MEEKHPVSFRGCLHGYGFDVACLKDKWEFYFESKPVVSLYFFLDLNIKNKYAEKTPA